jgi:NAD(P)-dependent dehydrogenase (short-subunit alcohol dehydrogenase family)
LIPGTNERLDVLIEKLGDAPVVIEAEVNNLRQAEIEAQQRLGLTLSGRTGVIDTAVALSYPAAIRQYQDAALRDALRTSQFEYAVFSRRPDGTSERLPGAGALQGGVVELAMLLHRASVPAWRVDALASQLEQGITRAAGDFSASNPAGSALGNKVAKALGQVDDEAGQTRRMAMAVVVNALIFQSALAEAAVPIPGSSRRVHRVVSDPSAMRSGVHFQPSKILDEWQRILAVNYWPIFHTASAIVKAMPTRSATKVLDVLWETAEELIAGGVTKSHDLTGIVFQRLIADRQFLKTYYTRPAAASLLAGLALPIARPLPAGGWADFEGLIDVKIGDFACGTGTLLSTLYQRLSLLHELHGGDPKKAHPRLMKEGLVGLDVLQVAVHLTAAMLAGSFAETPFSGDCLLTVPQGPHASGAAIGSLDLLDDAIQTGYAAATASAGGRVRRQVDALLTHLGHESFDVVIMNPPFTRHGTREGQTAGVHNPAFAAFDATEAEQDVLAARLTRLTRHSCGHGHAGFGSHFVELAHRKLAVGGTMAFVLPLTAMSGSSWEGVRSLWAQTYHDIAVVTIAESRVSTRSFSADTNMAECLVVAKKGPGGTEPRAVFAVLNAQPQNTVEAELIANAIHQAASSGVRKLEDGPFGGTAIRLGQTEAGTIVDCPIPDEGGWPLVGLSDITLGQTAFQLSVGRLFIEGMSHSPVVSIPVAKVRDVCARLGPHDLDITGSGVKADGLPQGPFEKIGGAVPGAAFPSLWNHDSASERMLVVRPDSHLRIRDVGGTVPQALQDRAALRWATASRVHYNREFQFNSQSLVVAFTEQRSIGGTAWPTVCFADDTWDYAFALWGNSTLGMMCHWWMANKTQNGRGRTTQTAVELFPTLNVAALSPAQLAAAESAFDAMKNERLLPFDQIDEDPVRAELDRRLLVDVLGLDPALCAAGGPMELLRRKLAAEPQIHGNKQTRIVFTPGGETTADRTDR